MSRIRADPGSSRSACVVGDERQPVPLGAQGQPADARDALSRKVRDEGPVPVDRSRSQREQLRPTRGERGALPRPHHVLGARRQSSNSALDVAPTAGRVVLDAVEREGAIGRALHERH